MNYEKAKQYRDEHLDLIGKTLPKGSIITAILVVPLNKEDYHDFINDFALNQDNDINLLPYANSKLTVEVMVDGSEKLTDPLGVRYSLDYVLRHFNKSV